jgi:hypothetical protein
MNGQPEARIADEETCRRFAEVCRLTQERLNRLTPAERDRLFQEHLAAGRSPDARFKTLCQMTTMMLCLRGGAARVRQAEVGDDGR